MAKSEYLNPNHGKDRCALMPVNDTPKTKAIQIYKIEISDLFKSMTKEVAMYKLIEYYRRNGRHELKRAFIDAIDEVFGKEM